MEQQSASIQSLPLQNLRVLVVDDEPDSSTLLVFTLEDSGAETKIASTARTALELVQQFQPHVLLSDINLPDADGYTLIRWVRALPVDQGSQTPAVAITAYALADVRDRALAEGFQQCLTKPIDLDELVTVVATMAKHHSSSCLATDGERM